jgi:hypothetical protein
LKKPMQNRIAYLPKAEAAELAKFAQPVTL